MSISLKELKSENTSLDYILLKVSQLLSLVDKNSEFEKIIITLNIVTDGKKKAIKVSNIAIKNENICLGSYFSLVFYNRILKLKSKATITSLSLRTK